MGTPRAPPAPGGGTGGAEPPAQPLWAPAHPAGAAHLHGPQRGFPVHPKDVGPAKIPRGDLSSAVRVFTSPNANLRPSLTQELLLPPAQFAQAAPALEFSHSQGCSRRVWFWDAVSQPQDQEWPQGVASRASSIPLLPQPGRAGPGHRAAPTHQLMLVDWLKAV